MLMLICNMIDIILYYIDMTVMQPQTLFTLSFTLIQTYSK
jgi:hypothetical protein